MKFALTPSISLPPKTLYAGWLVPLGLIWLGCHATGGSYAAEGPDQVLATVGDQEIRPAHVDLQLGRTADSRPLDEATLQAAIQLIAQQRQALQTLRRLKTAATRKEVEAWIMSQTGDSPDPPENAQQAVAATTARFGVTPQEYMEFVAFRLSWQRYLATHLTSRNLARHFQNQPQRFDGTRFRIDLLSIAVPAGASPARTAAHELFDDLSARFPEELDWTAVVAAAVAAESSVSPDLWVRGFGDLDPAVGTALLDTQPGELTEPIHTASGVHLARVREIQPGTKDLEQVTAEVRAHLLVFLLEHLAGQSRKQLPLRSPAAQ